MAELTELDTAVKTSLISPTNYSETSSISYSSPQSESETGPLHNNGNISSCILEDSSPIEENTPESMDSSEVKQEFENPDVPRNHLSTADSLIDNKSLVDEKNSSELDDKIFCKPDISPKFEKSPRELRSPRADRNSKSPKYSPRSTTELSPRSDRSPKPDQSPKFDTSPKPYQSPRRGEKRKAAANAVANIISQLPDINSDETAVESLDDQNVLINSVVDCKNGAVKRSRNRSDNSKTKKRINNNTRGRPPKFKESVKTTYHSQISGDKNAIKICIKKSNLIPQAPPTNKKSRKRKKQKYSDSDGSDIDSNYTSSRKNRNSGKSRDKNDKESVEEVVEPIEQTFWGSSIPEHILFKIFRTVCQDIGCLPTLVRLSKVCKLWRSVAQRPELWFNIDLSRERQKTDYRLLSLINNRLSHCQELNLSNWKINNISLILESITTKCTQLQGINLSGWNGLNSDHLKQISTQCTKLQRLDLSNINSVTTINKCAIGSQPLMQLADDMGERLTHLLLANNKLAGFPLIISAIATHCPNLQLLDLSNIKTVSHTTAPLHIEKLQKGCEKLRVLRITNSQIVLGTASLKEQVESPGFPNLEELSVATGSNDTALIDDNAIERILKNSHKLRLLDVRGCNRISDSSLVRVPAWDLEHLFLSGCYVTRFTGSGLELIAQKWSHSLLELDLAWSTATEPLDAAVMALAEKEDESRLRILNLCGSSVSLEPVKAVLKKCQHLNSINLSSCRALPRGIKRLYEGAEVAELLSSLEEKPKVVEQSPARADDERDTPSTTSMDNVCDKDVKTDTNTNTVLNNEQTLNNLVDETHSVLDNNG